MAGESSPPVSNENAETRIRVCRTKREQVLFERVPEILHGSDPAFIPDFPRSVAKQIAPDSVFCRVHGKIIPFIAERNGRFVGRIAAIQNHTHNRFYGDRAGFFGFFSCENNLQTARMLFSAAEKELLQWGCVSARGPYNPSINGECGLLTEGHNLPPCAGLTWNPDYYASLLESVGYQSFIEMLGFHLPLQKLNLPERLQKIAERSEKRSVLKLRPIKLPQIEEELEIIREVYNETLECNDGFIPISQEDLRTAASEIRAVADPEMILIAECKGQNAGVALSLPNINELLALTKRTPHWLRTLHFLWLLKSRRIRSARQVIYGIAPRFRDRGLHGWLLVAQFMTAKARYAYADLGWIQTNNKEILDHCALLGAVHWKTWRIFQKDLQLQ